VIFWDTPNKNRVNHEKVLGTALTQMLVSTIMPTVSVRLTMSQNTLTYWQAFCHQSSYTGKFCFTAHPTWCCLSMLYKWHLVMLHQMFEVNTPYFPYIIMILQEIDIQKSPHMVSVLPNWCLR
jgi:hypothetical protein